MHMEITESKQPVALLPAYIKHHSWGEYVFDFAWAEAHKHYGRPYYPKLVTAIPYTPCAGPRILLAPNTDLPRVLAFLSAQLPALAREYGFYSWHWLFAQQQDWAAANKTSWHRRLGCQYHWYNQHYSQFENFLANLTSRKRKVLRKERHQIQKAGIDFCWLEGADISAQEIANFYACYANTYHIRGRQPYLNAEVFSLLVQTMPEQIVLIKAQRQGKPDGNTQAVAYAWYFKDSETLYGRYWGYFEDIPLLHFETCYYQGIDYCIAKGLKHFDAGAQGEHKLARGFTPQATHSYHWLQETGFDPAIAQFCQQETRQVEQYMQWAYQQTPYRQDAVMT